MVYHETINIIKCHYRRRILGKCMNYALNIGVMDEVNANNCPQKVLVPCFRQQRQVNRLDVHIKSSPLRAAEEQLCRVNK